MNRHGDYRTPYDGRQILEAAVSDASLYNGD